MLLGWAGLKFLSYNQKQPIQDLLLARFRIAAIAHRV